MYDIKITSLQKLYLFKLADENNKTTITRFSFLFDCSKVNSKSILDRMLKLGLLYKENKTYLFTAVGQNISNDLINKRQKLKIALKSLFNLSEEEAVKYATDLICKDVGEFTKVVCECKKYFNHTYNVDDKISYINLSKLIGQGKFNIYVCIYKLTKDKVSNGNEFSMANRGFEKKASLVIGDDSKIILNTKTVQGEMQGYIKKSTVMDIHNGNCTDNLHINDGKIILPLKLLPKWYFISKNILQCGIYLYTTSKIGFIEHTKKSLFVFTLDLYNL